MRQVAKDVKRGYYDISMDVDYSPYAMSQEAFRGGYSYHKYIAVFQKLENG